VACFITSGNTAGEIIAPAMQTLAQAHLSLRGTRG
jgi:hypothetical protein